jgi:hypothetical protein
MRLPPPVRRALPVTGWGLFLLALALVGLIFDPNGTTLWLLFGMSGAVVTAGLTVLRSRRRPPPQETPDPADVPDLSVATVVAAFGVANIVMGTAVGQWLTYIAFGITAAGLGGIVREVRAERRERAARLEQFARRDLARHGEPGAGDAAGRLR